MGTHIQRKRFDHIQLALEQVDGFKDPLFQVPGVVIHATVVEDDDGIWVVVTQTGELVTGDEPCLPDYERVA